MFFLTHYRNHGSIAYHEVIVCRGMERRDPYSTMSQPSADKGRDPYRSTYAEHQVRKKRLVFHCIKSKDDPQNEWQSTLPCWENIREEICI